MERTVSTETRRLIKSVLHHANRLMKIPNSRTAHSRRCGAGDYLPLLVTLLTCSVLTWTSAQAETADTGQAEALGILKQYGAPADTASQLEHLQSLLPDPSLEPRINTLVVELGDDEYKVRRAAYDAILEIGTEARPQLMTALKSKDAEVRISAERLLESVDSPEELDKREALTRAALLLLRHRRETDAIPIVLAIAAKTEVAHLYDAASETIWATVNPTHGSRLREILANNNIKMQAIAIVALEVALGDEAIKDIVPFLQSDHEELRLAAARALIDRQPRKVARILIELLDSKNPEIYIQAHALLKTAFDQDLASDDQRSLAEVWREWANRHLPDAPVTKLELARLNLSFGRGILEETFGIPSKDVTNGYQRFQYESNVPTQASVTNGLLRLDGNHAEADQRLYVTSEKLIGQREWPRVVEVRSKLTGEDAGRGGYHVGLSVGRLKALFHPAYSGGGFRIETVDAHDYLVTNTNLGFTPAANTMHEMHLIVTRTPQGAKVDIEVIEGGGSKKRFSGSYDFTKEQLGKFNRIGLERSGRTGGAAIFDSLSIRLRK